MGFSETFAAEMTNGGLTADAGSFDDPATVEENLNQLRDFYGSLDDFNKGAIDDLATMGDLSEAGIPGGALLAVAYQSGRGLGDTLAAAETSYEVAQAAAAEGAESTDEVATAETESDEDVT
jgi:hypothetical protein